MDNGKRQKEKLEKVGIGFGGFDDVEFEVKPEVADDMAMLGGYIETMKREKGRICRKRKIVLRVQET